MLVSTLQRGSLVLSSDLCLSWACSCLPHFSVFHSAHLTVLWLPLATPPLLIIFLAKSPPLRFRLEHLLQDPGPPASLASAPKFHPQLFCPDSLITAQSLESDLFASGSTTCPGILCKSSNLLNLDFLSLQNRDNNTHHEGL